MLIVSGVLGYIVVIMSLLRVFQSIRKRDDEMRLITEEWLNETSGLPLEPRT
jgi:hypothetical protein